MQSLIFAFDAVFVCMQIQGKMKQVETADVDEADAPLAHADFFNEELQFGLNKIIRSVKLGSF
jgi:hypothetical protein